MDQLTLHAYPGGISNAYRYFPDGTVVLDSVRNGSYSTNKFTDALLRNTPFTYDGRGKIRTALNVVGVKDRQRMVYSGLGHLVQAIDTSQKQIGVPAPWTTAEGFTYDAFGNQRVVTRATTSFPWPGTTSNLETGENYTYATGTGRLLNRSSNAPKQDTLIYNRAGDVEREYSTIPTADPPPSEHDRASYYSSDGLLRAADDRSAKVYNGHIYSGDAYYTFEEYRYDALGRRVLTRSRRYCDMPSRIQHRLPCLISFLRRTVWDGAMELDEVQMPAGDSGTTAPAVADSITERDTGYAPLVSVDNPGTGSINDPNPFFGRAAYTYGLRLDQPVGVNRYGYLENAAGTDTAHHFAPYGLSPLWNQFGVVDVGVFADGGAVTCDQTGGTQRCTHLVNWLYGMTAYWRSVSDQLSWQGSLLEDKQDQSGLVYRRNRYLDPTTGQFTQEDPVGLAGGLNAYGFANGDPVSYSDPFGLWLCCSIPGAEVAYGVNLARAIAPNEYQDAVRRQHIRRAFESLIPLIVGTAGAGGRLAEANFAQMSFSEVFSAGGTFAGKTINEVAAGLRSGSIKVQDVPVEYIVREGKAIILNTRSSQALERAGVPRSLWNAVDMTENAAAQARLTEQLRRNNLPPTGTQTVNPEP